MADRKNDNEPDAKRLKQDDENDNNVNDGNLSDHSGSDASDASDDDSDAGSASDASGVGSDASHASGNASDKSDDENDDGGNNNNGNPPDPPRLIMDLQMNDPSIPVSQYFDGNVLRVKIDSTRWAQGSVSIQNNCADRIELIVVGILKMTLTPADRNFNMRLVQVRKVAEGIEIECSGPWRL